MKPFVSIFGSVLCLAVAHAEDITTTDGKVYKDVTIISHSDTSVTIETGNGGAIIPMDKLPADLQKKFGYDAKQAATEIKLRDQARAEGEKKEALVEQAKSILKESWEARGTILQVLPDGILVSQLCGYHPGDKQYAILAPSLGETAFVECDTTGLVDNVAWSGIVWKIGTFSYTNTLGAIATIPKYTAIPESAVKALGGSSQ